MNQAELHLFKQSDFETPSQSVKQEQYFQLKELEMATPIEDVNSAVILELKSSIKSNERIIADNLRVNE